MEYIYLRIGNFNIRINLNTKGEFGQKGIKAKTRIETDLFIYLKSFITFKKSKKIDFEIEFQDFEEELIQSQGNRNKKGYISLYELASDKKIITSYRISIYQFETILKRVLYLLINSTGGFGIHASTVKVNDKAYFFLGESGAGKTTISTLLGSKYPLISDDMSFVSKTNGGYYLFQAPFLEKKGWIKKSQTLYKVDKLFFIHKSREFKAIKTEDKQEIFRNIRRQIEIAQGNSINLHSINDFIKKLNFYHLYFAKDEQNTLKLINSIKNEKNKVK